jgi:hypothetical protein
MKHSFVLSNGVWSVLIATSFTIELSHWVSTVFTLKSVIHFLEETTCTPVCAGEQELLASERVVWAFEEG